MLQVGDKVRVVERKPQSHPGWLPVMDQFHGREGKVISYPESRYPCVQFDECPFLLYEWMESWLVKIDDKTDYQHALKLLG